MSCAAVFRDLNFDKTLLTFEGGGGGGNMEEKVIGDINSIVEEIFL